jgi:diguanylate cyclase (GGDEF)-like protein
MLQIEWKRAVRFNRDLSVVMLDIDHFKEYNDTYLHIQGDVVLKTIGKLLKDNLREVDTVARFGGEEFILLLPDTDKHGAIAVAEKVRKLVEKQKFMNENGKRTRTVTISCGVATYPDDVEQIDDLIDHADVALYKAKSAGRNQVVCYKTKVKKTEEKPTPKKKKSKPIKTAQTTKTLQ